MTKQIKAFLTIALLIILMIIAVIAYNTLGSKYSNNRPQGTSQAAPQAAPDFTVYDKDGNAVTLSSFKGKPVVVNFWASWCGYCDKEMPHFDALSQELSEDVVFLMINSTDGMRETIDSANAYIAKNEYKFSVYYDTDFSASNAYGVRGLPESYFIDKDGMLIQKASGMLQEETLREYVKEISGK